MQCFREYLGQDYLRPETRMRLRILGSKVPSGGTILDLGCDHGDIGNRGYSGRVFGADIAIDPLVAGKRRNPSYLLAAGDATRLPFPDAVFDGVVSFDVFDHCHDPALMAREVERVLKPGGVFVATIPRKKSSVLTRWRLADEWISQGHTEYPRETILGWCDSARLVQVFLRPVPGPSGSIAIGVWNWYRFARILLGRHLRFLPGLGLLRFGEPLLALPYAVKDGLGTLGHSRLGMTWLLEARKV